MNRRLKLQTKRIRTIERKLAERRRRAETMARLIDPEPGHRYVHPPPRGNSYTAYGGPCAQCGRWMQDPVHS